MKSAAVLPRPMTPDPSAFEAQVFMFVLAKRRLIKSQASELPGPQHLGISAAQPLRCQKSRRVLRPANVIRLPSFFPSPPGKPPSFWHVSAINFNWKLCVIILNFYCLTHEMETQQQFPKATHQDYPHANCSHGMGVYKELGV